MPYQNDKLIKSIDSQLNGLDIDNIIKNKEQYVVEKSIDEIQEYVKSGQISYEEITAIYLHRIKTLDQNEYGYNSVLEINPVAIKEARNMDLKKLKNSLLYGIPVMLKDNINTSNMPTSAGTIAFADFIPEDDADLVKSLKNQGAIILGKNNLTELANYTSTKMPAGYSSKKGQTINPFAPLKVSPSGSSSGSAVAVTANLVPISIGTETIGSIISPSAINSVVGFKPSRGSISNNGIFPLAKKLDTAGPIAKTVKDIVIAYNAISDENISLNLNDTSLNGKKVGLATYSFDDNHSLNSLKSSLKDFGANVIEVNIDEKEINAIDTLNLSFKKDFEDFANTYNIPIKSLKDLINFNNSDSKRRIKYGQNLLELSNKVDTIDINKIDNPIYKANSILDSIFRIYNLDVIVFLNNSGVIAPAVAGYPELTIPFGLDSSKVPQGATFVTKKGEDEKLLNIGYSFEKKTKGRVKP